MQYLWLLNSNILKLNIFSNEVNISLASFKFRMSELIGALLKPNTVKTTAASIAEGIVFTSIVFM